MADSKGKFKALKAQLCFKQLLFALIVLVIYTAIILLGYKRNTSVYNYVNLALLLPASYLSALAIHLENDWIFLPIYLFVDPMINFMHFLLHAMTNVIENKSYSHQLLISAEYACLLFSKGEVHRQIAVYVMNVVITLNSALARLPHLQKSKFGVQIICFLHSFMLDIIIGIPRDYQMNLLINSFVLLAILLFSQLFLLQIIGYFQALLIVTTIIIRVAANFINSLLFRSNSEGNEALLYISRSYGIFSAALSLLLQLLSFFDLKKTAGKCGGVLVGLLFLSVCAFVVLTPLCIIMLDVLLFSTGFYNIIGNSLNLKTSVLYALSLLLYKMFFTEHPDTNFVVFSYVIRGLCGVLSGSLVALLFTQHEFLKSVLFGSLTALFLAVPSAVNQLQELTRTGLGEIVSVCVVFCLVSVLPLLKKLQQSVFNALFLVIYFGLVLFAMLTEHISEGAILALFLIVLASIPQSVSVVAYVVAALLLLLAINARYAYVVITYASAVAAFSTISALFFTRFLMIKSSALRRMVTKAKITSSTAKINTRAFGLDEQEFDVFLTTAEAYNRGEVESNREDAERVFCSLYTQLYVFVATAAIIFSAWGFDAFALLLLALATLSLPAYERDEHGIKQVAGYFGVGTSWQYNQSNKQELVTRFAWTFFLMLEGRVIMDSVYFVVQLILDFDGVKQAVPLLLKDLGLNILISAAAMTGLAYITAQPLGFYRALQTQQRVKLLTVLSCASALISLFVTSKTIKTLLIFPIAGIFWSAPASAGITDKRIVEVESATA